MLVAMLTAPRCSHGMQAKLPSLAERFRSCKWQQQCCHPDLRKKMKAPAHRPGYYPRSLEVIPQYNMPVSPRHLRC